MLKSYNQQKELNKDLLIEDEEFLNDASAFLRDRVGVKEVMSSSEIYEKFMEHMRFQDSNEITAIRDLEYAQNADLEGKQRFGRLIDAYDKVDDITDLASGGRAVLDYAEAVARAPSTYIGILTGGTGKAASIAATQAAKLGTRTLLSQSLKSAAKNFAEAAAKPTITRAVLGGAAVEGVIGTGQGAVQETTRVETGLQDEFEGARTLAMGATSALGGGLASGLYAKLATKGKIVPGQAQQRAADEMGEKARLAKNIYASAANNLSKDTIKKNTKKAEKYKGVLNALDVSKVAEGRALKKDLSKSDTLEAAIGIETVENITAAAIRVADELEIKEGDRITTAIFNAMNNGKLGQMRNVDNILREHNLSMDQFSLIYMSEISDAARKLQMQGQAKKAASFAELTKKDAALQGLVDAVDGLSRQGRSGVNADEVKTIMSSNAPLQVMKKIGDATREANRFGIAAMTVQPATTMRNTLGGGFRLAVDATTRVMDNTVVSIGGKLGYKNADGTPMRVPENIFSGAGDVAKYMLNPAEGRLVRQLLREDMPNEIDKLFREAADVYSNTKSKNVVADWGRRINVLNTASDNIFKQAVLAGSLKRRLKDEGIDIDSAIEQGVLNRISRETIQGAITDAYEFTYQSSFRGQGWRQSLARGAISVPEKAPAPIAMLYSAFMPFPRFIANQLKFQYEHAPIIGMLEFLNKDANKPKILSKQLTGAAMLSSALAWRVQQGPDSEWYDIKTGENEYINGKAIYGPLAPFMVAADIIYRNFNEQAALPENAYSYYSKAFIEATLGSTFRTGLGIAGLEPLYNTFTGKRTADEKAQLDVAEIAGDYLGRYAIPAGVVKDIYAQFDKEARYIPATRTGEENFLELVYKTATRNLPDLTQERGLQYDQPAYSPYQTGPLRAVHPIEKQLFGATVMLKTPLQKEMSSLGMEYRDLYKAFPDKKVDFYVRQELARPDAEHNLNERLSAFIKTDKYRNASSAGKREMLAKYSSKPIEEAKKLAATRLRAEAKRKGKPYSRMDIVAWEKLTKDEQTMVNEYFQEEFGGNSVQEDMDRVIYMPDGTVINVLLWANQVAPKVKQFVKE